ncbi:MAG TPA: NifU family protein [Actinoplanes sp.]|nr:NifU family protein [Actinoplanes sp.]
MTDPRDVGERIDQLIDALSTGGPAARERAEELVRVVVDLYGAGLERLLQIVGPGLSDSTVDELAADELVSGLLVVHGLHPYDVTDRVERALESVRPYLRSHGGDVELLEVDGHGAVRLRLLGHCDGCAGSTATLRTAVEAAIDAAAPEVVRVDVEEPTAPAHPAPVGAFIPAEAVTVRARP